MITINNYVPAKSIEEAYQLNQSRRNRIIGGMLWMKLGHGSVDTVIDLSGLGLGTIEETAEAFVIGAMTSLRDLELHPALNEYTLNAVRNAVKNIVGVQFRNMATVGGSIWGRFGFSDVLTVFLSMDTYVELYKGGVIPLEEFVTMKPDNDILMHLIVKKTPGKFIYKSMRNQRTDFPVLTCAVSAVSGEYRAIIGARPGRAMLVRDEKGILACGIHSENAGRFAEYVCESVPTGSNLRASREYRKHLVKVVVCRALHELGGAE